MGLIASSGSFKRNKKIIEEEVKRLFQRGEKNGIIFDPDKTELIHFSNSKQVKATIITLLIGIVIKPKNLVCWLGVYFDPLLSFKEHASRRISKARNTLFRLSRLANVERGLSPAAIRQLYNACVISSADYACELYGKNTGVFLRQAIKLQNLALRKILGVFKTAPIIPLEVEAAIPPVPLRLE